MIRASSRPLSWAEWRRAREPRPVAAGTREHCEMVRSGKEPHHAWFWDEWAGWAFAGLVSFGLLSVEAQRSEPAETSGKGAA